jgi:hypothetical protein
MADKGNAFDHHPVGDIIARAAGYYRIVLGQLRLGS